MLVFEIKLVFQTLQYLFFYSKPMTEEAKPKIIAVGNPGAGKSAFLNSLAEEVLFKSGVSVGKGMTSKIDEKENNNGHFLNLDLNLDLCDKKLRKKVRETISKGLKKGGSYKVIFFVTQEAGRVNQQDTKTLKLVHEAAPDIGMEYGIIVNKVPKEVLKTLEDETLKFDFLNTIFAGIPEEKKCANSNVRLFRRISNIEDEKEPTKFKDDSGLSLNNFVHDVIPTVEITEEARPKIIAVGNPGAGKSTILNSLAEEVLFKSGVKSGGGLTYELDERKNKNGHFLDTPGLADEDLRKKAGEAISEGLRKGGSLGSYKVIFFVTQEAGRVNQQDATTLKLVLEAAPDIGMDYGIIVNKVSPGVLEMFSEEAEKFNFLNTLFAGIPEERKCVYSNVKFFGRISELEDRKDKLFSPTELKDDSGLPLNDFVHDWIPTVEITDTNVSNVNTELFDEMTKKVERLAQQLHENSDQWKEERRQLETQKIKDNEESRRQMNQFKKQEDLLKQGNAWRFVGDGLFQKAIDYIDVQSQGFRSQSLSFSKGLIIENNSSYNLLYKDSKFTCGYPLKTFDDDEMLFNNKSIPPNTAIAQFTQNSQTGHLCKYTNSNKLLLYVLNIVFVYYSKGSCKCCLFWNCTSCASMPCSRLRFISV